MENYQLIIIVCAIIAIICYLTKIIEDAKTRKAQEAYEVVLKQQGKGIPNVVGSNGLNEHGYYNAQPQYLKEKISKEAVKKTKNHFIPGETQKETFEMPLTQKTETIFQNLSN